MTSNEIYNEAISIVRFLSSSDNKGNIVSIDDGISPEKLIFLAENWEDYRPTRETGEIYEEPRKMESKLRMYGNYLRDLNNPSLVLGDALLKLTPVSQEPGYHIPWEYHPAREKYNKIGRHLRKWIRFISGK